jgi:hypothetical protein
MERERARRALCAPAAPVSRPPPADARVPPCAGQRYRCLGGLIVSCDGARATCIKGCAEEGASLDDEDLTDEGAAAILCSR